MASALKSAAKSCLKFRSAIPNSIRVLFANVRNEPDYSMCSKKFYATAEECKKTVLYDFHVSHGGKMVPFAGYMMPVQYKEGIGQSHTHVRKEVGIFDVSHMLQTKISGKDRVQFIESMIVSDIAQLKDNQGCLSVFTNENGGINDDLIVTKTNEDYLFVVSNAGCADKDLANLQKNAERFRSQQLDVEVEVIHNGLIALQGPSMVKVLQPGLDFHLSELHFMRTKLTTVYGIPNCRVTRCGYTGEDGVEISVAANQTEELVKELLNNKVADVHMIGLGARDSLRLEAGLCLYGSDIDESTTPVEAGLTWTIGKRRREAADFPGAKLILDQIRTSPTKRRTGVVSQSGAPARGGSLIFSEDGNCEIGKVTSGVPSPSLGYNISMGYVNNDYTKPGTKVKLQVRKNMVDGEVVKMPFIKANYYTGK